MESFLLILQLSKLRSKRLNYFPKSNTNRKVLLKRVRQLFIEWYQTVSPNSGSEVKIYRNMLTTHRAIEICWITKLWWEPREDQFNQKQSAGEVPLTPFPLPTCHSLMILWSVVTLVIITLWFTTTISTPLMLPSICSISLQNLTPMWTP